MYLAATMAWLWFEQDHMCAVRDTEPVPYYAENVALAKIQAKTEKELRLWFLVHRCPRREIDT